MTYNGQVLHCHISGLKNTKVLNIEVTPSGALIMTSLLVSQKCWPPLAIGNALNPSRRY